MLSVVIITKNEEKTIRACLESVKWADEIIVVDHGVTDGTIKIAREYTDKIFEVKVADFAEIRNKAFEKTKGDWVLYIDPDERILKPLKHELIEITGRGKGAYAISRRNIIFGSEQRYGPFWPDWVIRFVKRSAFKGWVGKVHEYMTFDGELGYTKNSLLHLTHRDVNQIILKSLDWSEIDAKLRIEAKHPKMTGWRFLRILIGELFYQGVIRKGFFSGAIGVVDSVLQVFSLFITYVKMWQMQKGKSSEEIYKDLDKKLVGNKFDY